MKRQNNNRFGAAVLLLILLFTLSACSCGQSESSPLESSPPISMRQEETAQPETEQSETPDAAVNEVILYIGTKDNGFNTMRNKVFINKHIYFISLMPHHIYNSILTGDFPSHPLQAESSFPFSVCSANSIIPSASYRSFPL